MFSATSKLGVFLLTGWLALAGRLSAWDAGGTNPWSRILAQHGIVEDDAGLIEYLRQRLPDSDRRKLAERFIAQLGAKDYRTRQEAMLRLQGLGSDADEVLSRAKNSPDPEIRWRVRAILSRRKQTNDYAVLRAVLQTIKLRNAGGALPVLLKVAATQTERFRIREFADVAAFVSRPSDRKLLRRELTNESAAVRLCAVRALDRHCGKDEVEYFVASARDRNADVKLQAARILANRGRRESLAVLIALLSASDVSIRAESESILVALTGQRFGVAAYGADDKRKQATAAWSKWLADAGATAKLKFPLRISSEGRGDLLGNSLIAFGHVGRVEERTPDGTVVWKFSIAKARSAEKLPNGNYLVAAWGANKVVEVDRSGKIVWELPAGAMNARLLANGNILVADYNGQRAFEVNRAKETVWEYKPGKSCTDAIRIANGNTLVCNGNRVVELTPEKKVVETWTGSFLFGVQRLSNGNTLIADAGASKVIEYAPDKTVVWEVKVSDVVDAFRLPNGNTIVTNGKRAAELTPDKKEVWKLEGIQWGQVRR